MAKRKAATGRPSLYSEELAERIANELMEGKSLVKICDAEDMPHRRTVLRWMEADESFATKCARARIWQADLMDDKINDLIESCTAESAPADRVKLAAMQWRAAKLLPKKYGDKITHAGDPENPIALVPVLNVFTRSADDQPRITSKAVNGAQHKSN